MKQRFKELTAASTRTTVFAAPGLGTSTDVTTYGTGYDGVQSGGIIRGNFRDPNPWWYQIDRYDLPLGYLQTTERTTWYDENGEHVGFNRTFDQPQNVLMCRGLEEMQSLILQSREEAFNDLVEKTRGSIDLSIDVFQARQTKQMLNVMERVEDAVKQLPRLPKRSVADLTLKSVKYLGGKWVEWVYGISPMLSTIHGIAEETLMHNMNETVRVEGRKSLKETLNKREPSNRGGSSSAIVHRGQIFAKTRFSVTLNAPTPFELDRLTSLNPVSIAYELLPWSFVVDWFYDMGSYIRGLETSMLYSSQFKSGYVTTVAGFDSTAAGAWISSSSLGSYMESHNACRRFRDFSRELLWDYPVPTAPRLRLDLSSGRMLNAAGLMSQFLRR